jgi:polyisoprenoid-binding protein YceI
MLKKLIGAVIVVVLVGGAAFWYFVLRDDPPPELSVDSTNGDADASTTVGTTPASLDGTWTVQDGGDTTAGFRIVESFANGLTDHTAVGRSDDVTGSITIDGTQVTKGDFTVDLGGLTFSDSPGGLSVANRANAMKSRGLETSQFPEATFELTGPVDFGKEPEADQTVTAKATGNLTIHGVTNEVTFEVEAKLAGDTIRVATADPVPVVLTDYDIDKPTGGPVAEIADEGSFEFLIVLGQG